MNKDLEKALKELPGIDLDNLKVIKNSKPKKTQKNVQEKLKIIQKKVV